MKGLASYPLSEAVSSNNMSRAIFSRDCLFEAPAQKRQRRQAFGLSAMAFRGTVFSDRETNRFRVRLSLPLLKETSLDRWRPNR